MDMSKARAEGRGAVGAPPHQSQEHSESSALASAAGGARLRSPFHNPPFSRPLHCCCFPFQQPQQGRHSKLRGAEWGGPARHGAAPHPCPLGFLCSALCLGCQALGRCLVPRPPTR